ncbi:MAG: hypothetical protein V1883_02460 [Candidatus Omnitrophota bacterium]
MEKIKYEIDPHNRLIAKISRRRSGIPKFRHVIDGEFKTGPSNTLIYHIKSPSKGITEELDLPYQVKLGGVWSLTKNHELKLIFDKCQLEGFRNDVVLKGEIIGANSDSILFSVTQKTGDGFSRTSILRLEGIWQADEYNRLMFKAKKESDKYDTLVFEGRWEINKQHKIAYKYAKGRDKSERSVLFDGFWNVTEKDKLTYHLDFMNRSFFNFRVGKGTASQNNIRYEIGIGARAQRRPKARYLVLYGKWNIRKSVGLVFEIDYGDGQTGGIVFTAEAKLTADSRIKFELKTESGKSLGVSLTLSRTILKGVGELYSKVLFSEKEKAVYIGGGVRW